MTQREFDTRVKGGGERPSAKTRSKWPRAAISGRQLIAIMAAAFFSTLAFQIAAGSGAIAELRGELPGMTQVAIDSGNLGLAAALGKTHAQIANAQDSASDVLSSAAWEARRIATEIISGPSGVLQPDAQDFSVFAPAMPQTGISAARIGLLGLLLVLFLVLPTLVLSRTGAFGRGRAFRYASHR